MNTSFWCIDMFYPQMILTSQRLTSSWSGLITAHSFCALAPPIIAQKLTRYNAPLNTVLGVMNWVDEMLQLLEIVWSWPTVVLIVVLVFRKTIKQFFGKLASSDEVQAKAGAFELSWSPSRFSDSAEKLPDLVPIKSQSFRNQRIDLDGKYFEECTFIQCELVLGATKPVGLKNNHMVDCSWTFDGPAAQTLSFLSALYKSAPGLIEKTFENIKSNADA